MDAQSIQAVAAAISAVAAAVALLSLYLLAKQRSTDHERSRRERAIELVRFWTTALTSRAAITKKFVERLDENQTRALWRMEAFSVTADLEPALRACLPAELEKQVTVASGRVMIPGEVVASLRWEMVTYLNQLEAVLMAWRHSVADRELLEEQFKYLVKPADGSDLLEKLRTAADGSSGWPSVKQFAVHLRKTSDPEAQKPPL